LRREVEALLAYEEQTESFLETPAVFGFSQGVTEGVIFTAVEQRYRAVVLMAGGLWLPDKDALAEVNHVNFAPYIQAPKLMLNGRYASAGHAD
jgi:predicted esterase